MKIGNRAFQFPEGFEVVEPEKSPNQDYDEEVSFEIRVSNERIKFGTALSYLAIDPTSGSKYFDIIASNHVNMKTETQIDNSRLKYDGIDPETGLKKYKSVGDYFFNEYYDEVGKNTMYCVSGKILSDVGRSCRRQIDFGDIVIQYYFSRDDIKHVVEIDNELKGILKRSRVE